MCDSENFRSEKVNKNTKVVRKPEGLVAFVKIHEQRYKTQFHNPSTISISLKPFLIAKYPILNGP